MDDIICVDLTVLDKNQLNMGLQALQGVLNAQQKESAQNSKAQIALPEIPGITPSIKLFGKSM